MHRTPRRPFASRLPQIIASNGSCAIKLRRSRTYPRPERFRVLKYRRSLLDVVEQCVDQGSRRGGYVPIGQEGQIDAWIWGILDDEPAKVTNT